MEEDPCGCPCLSRWIELALAPDAITHATASTGTSTEASFLFASKWLPWRVLHSTRGYCGSPGTVGTADGYCRVLWVLQGTVGTARAKVTVGYCSSTRGYCRVLWVL
jgi:hypothetical protein